MERRKFVLGLGSASIAALAGCLGDDGETDDDDNADNGAGGTPSDDGSADDGNGGSDEEPSLDISERGDADGIERVNELCNTDDDPTSAQIFVPAHGGFIEFGGEVVVPNSGYDVVLDDVSYDDAEDTLIITLDHEQIEDSNNDACGDEGGIVSYRGEGALNGPTPSAFRIDIYDRDGLQEDVLTVEHES